jgi:hypothetical protein
LRKVAFTATAHSTKTWPWNCHNLFVSTFVWTPMAPITTTTKDQGNQNQREEDYRSKPSSEIFSTCRLTMDSCLDLWFSMATGCFNRCHSKPSFQKYRIFSILFFTLTRLTFFLNKLCLFCFSLFDLYIINLNWSNLSVFSFEFYNFDSFFAFLDFSFLLLLFAFFFISQWITINF